MLSKKEALGYFAECDELFTFLSQVLFKELTQEAVDALDAAVFDGEYGNPSLQEGYRLIRRYFKLSSGDKRSQLACEYARVFLAAGVYSREKETAIPYESVFTSEEHLVMQEARDQVRAFFAEDSFLVDPGLHEPEDHLAFELEYIANMNRRAAQLYEDKDAAGIVRNLRRQRYFLEHHILNWVSGLRRVAEEYAKLTFYIGILYLVEGYAQTSIAVIDELLAPPQQAAA